MVRNEFTIIMTLLEENVSRLEFCGLCNEVKDSFVDIFETMVFKEDCLLVDRLKDLFGVEASANDEMSKFICIDCVRDIKFQGNVSYGLWSTLDYLLRMHEEKKMETTAFNIPKESLDFLISEKKEYFTKSIALPNDFDLSETPVMECSKNSGLDCVQSELEEPVEYCWCSECNAEFLNKGELRVHLKMHENFESKDYLNEATDSAVSNEEYKLISGERSLLKSRLCCSKCQKEFRSEKRLVKHIKKHDFKCKPRNFESLNCLLKSLKSDYPEDNTLLNNQDYNSSCPIDSNIHDSKGSSVYSSYDSGSGEDTTLSSKGILSRFDKSTRSQFKGTSNFLNGFPIIKSTKISRVATSRAGSHISLFHSLKLDISCVNNTFVVCEKNQKDVAVIGKPVVSTCKSEDRNDISSFLDEKLIFKSVTGVDGVIVNCDYCNKSFTLKSNLRELIVLCHLSIAVHKCFTCYNVFPSENELRTHCAVHTSKSKYICTLCNDNFSSKLKMSNHLKDVHQSSQGCICGVCFLGFPSRVELGLHQTCHSHDKKYKCSKCGKAYSDKAWYTSHVSFCQLRTVAHECEKCGKKFIKKSGLDIHHYSHSSDKRFSCHLCPKQFTQCGRLLVHIRSAHLKLKPHECGICKKTFCARYQLKEHYCVHSDDRPFSCELCGKTFKRRYGVFLHKKAVHGGTR